MSPTGEEERGSAYRERQRQESRETACLGERDQLAELREERRHERDHEQGERPADDERRVPTSREQREERQGEDFARAYFGIWLGEAPLDRGLRDQLLKAR